MASKTKRKPRAKKHPYLYGCCGCGYVTSGCVSKSTGREYECCPDCAERVDALVERSGPAFEGQEVDDKGPYRERKPFPPCPKCGSKDIDGMASEYELTCMDCDHAWTPPGIYLDDDADSAAAPQPATQEGR